MRKIVVFNHVTLDGFFTDPKGDMSFAHRQGPDPEWDEFLEGNTKGGGELLFGRITYDMMASFWPTPAAEQMMPEVAERMNALPKVVFSRTMNEASWKNARVVKGNLAEEVRKLKAQSGPDMVILGSGTIVSQLTEAGLIDSYQIVVNPVVIGRGRTMFEGVTSRPALKLTETRTFKNGNVLLCYGPQA
jgi:dihydrofolate reductase